MVHLLAIHSGATASRFICMLTAADSSPHSAQCAQNILDEITTYPSSWDTIGASMIVFLAVEGASMIKLLGC